MSASPARIAHYQSVAAQAARLNLADKLDIVVRSPTAMNAFNEFVGPDLGWAIAALLSGEIELRNDGTQDALIRQVDYLRSMANVYLSRRISTGLVVDTFLSVDEEG